MGSKEFFGMTGVRIAWDLVLVGMAVVLTEGTRHIYINIDI